MIETRHIAAFLRRTEESVVLQLIDEGLIDEIEPVDSSLAQRFSCSQIAQLVGPKLDSGVCSISWMQSYLAASVRWQRFAKKRGLID